MRNRSFRRFKAFTKMMKRLKEDRNQHYEWLDCPCHHDKKAKAKFKEQPAHCSKECCGNQRKYYGRSIQERKAGWNDKENRSLYSF